MTIAPSTVLLNYVPTRGDGQPVNTVFTCGGFTEMNVKYIQNLKIYRLTRNDLPGTTGFGPVVATMDALPPPPAASIIMQELQSRATVDGNIDSLDYSASFLSVTFETAQLQCKDEGMYTCEINYETNGAVGLSPTQSTNLTTNGMYITEKHYNQARSQAEARKSQHNMCLSAKISDFVTCKQQRRRPACTSTLSDQRLYYSLSEKSRN